MTKLPCKHLCCQTGDPNEIVVREDARAGAHTTDILRSPLEVGAVPAAKPPGVPILARPSDVTARPSQRAPGASHLPAAARDVIRPSRFRSLCQRLPTSI